MRPRSITNPYLFLAFSLLVAGAVSSAQAPATQGVPAKAKVYPPQLVDTGSRCSSETALFAMVATRLAAKAGPT